MPPPTHPPTRAPLRVFVSDEAFRTLVERAQRRGWIRPDLDPDDPRHRPRGLASYLVATLLHPAQVWADTRPEWMRHADVARLQAGRFPMWADPDETANNREQRSLGANAVAIVEPIRELVFQRGMFPSDRTNPTYSDAACVGIFLEAWGQGNITPAHEPQPLHPVRRSARRHPLKEIAW